MNWFPFSFLLIILSFCHTSAKRQLTTNLNPNCTLPECQYDPYGSINLIHTISVGTNDTLHHVWSTVGDVPSLLVAQTSNSAELQTNWMENKSAPGGVSVAVSFSEQPEYVFALVLSKLIQFNDAKDKGVMSPDMGNVSFADLKDFLWQNVSGSNDGSHSTITFTTKLNTSDVFLRDEGGYLAIQLETQGDDGRYTKIPRLLFTPESTQIRIILANATSHYENPRFAVELSVLVTEDSDVADPFSVETLKSMDDEYTPGVFKSVHVRSKKSQNKGFGAFLNWKPVVYTGDELSVTGSTEAVHYDPISANLSEIPDSVATAFFNTLNDFHNEKITVMTMNISFGTSQDGFYNNTNYSEWTFSYGLGVPSTDKLSTLVMIILGTGLGIPLLLIILSSIYMGYHRMKMQKDDLHLSRR